MREERSIFPSALSSSSRAVLAEQAEECFILGREGAGAEDTHILFHRNPLQGGGMTPYSV